MPDQVRSLPVDIKYKQSSYRFHGRYEFVEPYCGRPGRFHTNEDSGKITTLPQHPGRVANVATTYSAS